jgi:hypothetical protein
MATEVTSEYLHVLSSTILDLREIKKPQEGFSDSSHDVK